MKFLNKHKVIIILFLIIAGTVAFFLLKPKKEVLTSVTYKEVERGTLLNSISVKGIVESESVQNVYATSGYQINNVLVEVGDKVTAGQLLLKVDTDELEATIKERKATLSKSSETSLVNLENNKRVLNDAKANYDKGEDASIITAKSRIETAQINYDNAKKNYDDKVADLANGEISTLITAENNLRNAEIDLNNKKSDIEKSKILYDAGTIAKDEYDKMERALEASQNTYNDALKAVETTKLSIESEITKLKQTLDSAEVSIKEATDSLVSAETTIKQNIDKYTDSVKSSEVAIKTDSDLIAISNLENKLSKSKVTSPIEGTITAVFAKDGQNAQGLMFVVENTESLKIITRIKEYDSNSVKPGMKVTITSDATGDQVYEGEVKKIAPTSIKDATGKNLTTNDVEFETEISVKGDSTGLKIGMNTKLDVILEEKINTLYVSPDSITQNENDDDIVYILTTDEEGNDIAKAQKVNIVQELDLYTEITGIEEGLKVIQDPSEVKDGMKVTVTNSIRTSDEDVTEEAK